MGARRKVNVEIIEITKITNKIKNKVTDSELKNIRNGLKLLKLAQETLSDGDEVHKNDLKQIGVPLGMRLKSAREKKNLTQEALEKLSNVSQATISKIESGSKMVSNNEAKSIAKVLGVTPQYLIAGE